MHLLCVYKNLSPVGSMRKTPYQSVYYWPWVPPRFTPRSSAHIHQINDWNNLSKKEGNQASSPLVNIYSVWGFFVLCFLHLILLLFKKGMVTHNLHTENQPSKSMHGLAIITWPRNDKRSQSSPRARALSKTIGGMATGRASTEGIWQHLPKLFAHLLFGPATQFL